MWLQVLLHSGAEQQGDTLHYVESSTMLGRVCRCMDEAASRGHQAGEVPCSRGQDWIDACTWPAYGLKHDGTYGLEQRCALFL